MKDVTFEELRQLAEGKGSLKVVLLHLPNPHYNSAFIKEVIAELEQTTQDILLARAIGDDAVTYTPCQKMVYQILSENV
jgi:hypothetical protein